MFVGQHASEVLGSAIPVEAGDGMPSNSKATRDNNELRVKLMSGNGHVGIRPSPPKR